ncbi:MAG: Fic family protein [Candidatus Thiodiazotropha sp.]
MKKEGRYNVSDSIEAQFEPGSNNTVLRNKLGITDPNEMDRVEAQALINATDALIHEYDAEHQFCAADICHLHQTWLGNIYEWAGKYRSVNISKDDFSFAMAAQIPKLMGILEAEQLKKYTPCIFENRNDVIKALAEVHTELLLIHPFREGNGRCSRILTSIMALQAGLPILDFSLISEVKRQDYISAVQNGMDRNYIPMEKLFEEIIEISIRTFSS